MEFTVKIKVNIDFSKSEWTEESLKSYISKRIYGIDLQLGEEYSEYIDEVHFIKENVQQ